MIVLAYDQEARLRAKQRFLAIEVARLVRSFREALLSPQEASQAAQEMLQRDDLPDELRSYVITFQEEVQRSYTQPSA